MLGLALLGGDRRIPPVHWWFPLVPPSYSDGYDWVLVGDDVVLVPPRVLASLEVISGGNYEQYVLGNYSCNR